MLERLTELSHLHHVADGMSDFGALLLSSGLTALLIDDIYHVPTLLTAVGLQ